MSKVDLPDGRLIHSSSDQLGAGSFKIPADRCCADAAVGARTTERSINPMRCIQLTYA